MNYFFRDTLGKKVIKVLKDHPDIGYAEKSVHIFLVGQLNCFFYSFFCLGFPWNGWHARKTWSQRGTGIYIFFWKKVPQEYCNDWKLHPIFFRQCARMNTNVYFLNALKQSYSNKRLYSTMSP